MTDLRFVDRIADVYLEIYRANGFKEARLYAERIIGNDEALKKEVKKAAEAKISEKLGRKNGGPKKDGA